MSAELALQVGAIAIGTLAAQKFIQAMRLGDAEPAEIVEELRELQIAEGIESPAINAFLIEICKRAR